MNPKKVGNIVPKKQGGDENPTPSNRSGLTTAGILDYLTVTHEEINTYRVKDAFKKVAEITPLFTQEGTDEDEAEITNMYSRDWSNVKRWFHGSYIGQGLKRFGTRFEGDPSKAGIVNLGGSALKIMRDAGYSDKHILKWFIDEGFTITRIDFAIDFTSKRHWKSLVGNVKGGYYSTNVPTKNINWIENNDDEYDQTKGPHVRTIYIGSQKNADTLICAYDKKYQIKEVYKKTVNVDAWYRLELRTKRTMARRMAETLKKYDYDLVKVCRGRIMGFIEFKSKARFEGAKIKNKQRIPAARWWQDLIGFTKIGLEEIGANEDDYEVYKTETDKRIGSQLMTRILMLESDEVIKSLRNEADVPEIIARICRERTDDVKEIMMSAVEKFDDKKTSRLERLRKDREEKITKAKERFEKGLA